MIADDRGFNRWAEWSAPWHPGRLWSLWAMLHSYFPIYQIALELQWLRSESEFWKKSNPSRELWPQDAERFQALLEAIHQKCSYYNLTDTSDMAKRVIDGMTGSKTYADILPDLNHLNGSLSNQLQKEAVFRVHPDLKKHYEKDDLFGPKVAAVFPSCARDIRKAGSCYAVEQEDACVHHLMLVLERGLNALAAKLGVPYQHTQWQVIINEIESKIKSLPRGELRDFYHEVNAQFGFLKVAYRNHSQHVHDDLYDMPKAEHILNHVRSFMQELAKGGLSDESASAPTSPTASAEQSS